MAICLHVLLILLRYFENIFQKIKAPCILVQYRGMKDSRIPWHLAFVAAIQLELAAYNDCLEFFPEVQLTTEPLRIDCVVIKKVKNVMIKKNIASVFKEVNLLEYKSPGKSVSVVEFYKVYGYAYQYVYLKNVSITDLSISFIQNHFPVKLLEHLKNVRGYAVEETMSGIYNIKGDILPIQVIDTRKLSEEENLWLKGLSNRLDPVAVLKIGDKAVKQKKTALIKAYMETIAKANFQAIEEAMRMSTAAKSLDEVLERTGLAAKWEARERLAIAKNMINLGLPLETIVSATKLEPEKVKELSHFQNSVEPKVRSFRKWLSKNR